MSTPDATGGRVLVVVRMLSVGGAERQAAALVSALHERGQAARLVCFYGGGPLEPPLRDAGVDVRDVGKRHRWDVLGFAWRLVREVRGFRPTVVYGFLNGPNLVLAALRPFWWRTLVVWGIRSTNMDLAAEERFVGTMYRLENVLAPLADAVICNSWAGRDDALERGLRADHVHVVANGIDVERFRPNASGRREVRAAWGIAPGAELIGAVGRLHPMKDLPTFVRAAAEVLRDRPGCRAVVVGPDPDGMGAELAALAGDLGIGDRLVVEPARSDVAEVMSAFDVLVSSSRYGEGFSNVLAEAMACGTSVVASDVGDARLVVGDVGRVVPSGDAAALARAIALELDARSADPSGAADRVRGRIIERFGVDRMVDDTLLVFAEEEQRRATRARRRWWPVRRTGRSS